MEKWFYVCSIATQIYSDKGCSFENDILTQLYSMYGIKHSIAMPYNPHGNSICEWFKCTLLNLLKTLPKEQKLDWPSHVPSLVFAYHATPHSITEYRPYELMYGHKAPTISVAWPGLANYDEDLRSQSSYIHTQYELITSANWHALKHIKQMAKQCAARVGGRPLQIPVGNPVLIRDHPESWNKIQDSYKSDLFVMESQHQDPNVYAIKLVSGKGAVWKVNQHWLFDLKRYLGDPDPTVCVQNINVLKYQTKKKLTQTPNLVTLMGPTQRLRLQPLQLPHQWSLMMAWLAVTLHH